MSAQIEIADVKSLDEFLKDHVNELNKTVLGSLTKGARITNKAILTAMPGSLQKFKPILGVKSLGKSGNPSVLLGFFGKKLYYINHRGIKWDAFYMVYWQNYGTMANRDSSHKFQTARRRKTINFKGGIKPLLFFEKGISNGHEEGRQAAENDLSKIIDAISEKFGFR